ncbi:hypothetical protein SAMN02745945_02850 [Peptoclostridium litorale DSM 5388]|uniref:Uncharacterized protein n=1 Tax=Peptoclostridium litorale DSM 5388 TaxID=1121324 RepID=A0A069RIB6_PEPLI|nr:hypothetical protein [Peptoclostridium litorale]KDR96769.1 hypothetical protein CLIT_2c03750 [Peptoclostridium litorale DSM 5388]SIO34607.1 hypothetical protein SAMN02745945_02850 [Peptoclostridium litorale DSM 5388]
MDANVKKIQDIHGDYIEIEKDGKTMRFGYEIAEDGEIMDRRVMLANEHAIDFVSENIEKFDWDDILCLHGTDAKKMVEKRLNELGFEETVYFIKK